MRQKRTLQSSIFDQFADHHIGQELRAMSELLDHHPELIDWVYADTVSVDTQQTGCRGLSAESILRCALLKQYRLPKSDSDRHALAATIGADGQQLLDAIDTDMAWLNEIPAVQTLRCVWAEQFVAVDGRLVWRDPKTLPSPADLIASPYDTDACYSTKRRTDWVGYKVHLTETCDADTPHLIVNVATTPATTPDDGMAAVIHNDLAARDRLPGEHLLDKGYVNTAAILTAQQAHDITVIGPVCDPPNWQAREGLGFDKAHFIVDWEKHIVTCPAGKCTSSWQNKPYLNGGVAVRFSRKDCNACQHRAHCTRAKTEPRTLTLAPRVEHEVLQGRRAWQQTEEFKECYAERAGVESTHEQAIRRCGLRQSRYIGLEKTRLQHIVTAVTINVIRIGEWLLGRPMAKTRCSPFAALQPAA